MTELTARLAIYGAIDHAVLEGRLPAELVGTYLTPYLPDFVGDDIRPAPGWYDALAEVLGNGTEEQNGGAPLLPPVSTDPTEALAELAELPVEHEIDSEHRVRALYLARRLLSVPNGSSDDPFVLALQRAVEFDAGPVGVEDPVGAAMALSELIDDDGSGGEDGGGDYRRVVEAAAERGVLSTMTAALASATCNESTAWFQVPGSADVDAAAVITSQIVVDDVAERSVDDLRLNFHPGRWPTCLPAFWLEMKALAPPDKLPSPTDDPEGTKFVYRERVGDRANNSEWFRPVLEFWYDELIGGPVTDRDVVGFAIHYGMADPLPAGEAQDARILIDDGELTARRSQSVSGVMTVTATTHKVLAMQQPMSGPGVAVFACASGWADQAKALITGCLFNP